MNNSVSEVQPTGWRCSPFDVRVLGTRPRVSGPRLLSGDRGVRAALKLSVPRATMALGQLTTPTTKYHSMTRIAADGGSVLGSPPAWDPVEKRPASIPKRPRTRHRVRGLTHARATAAPLDEIARRGTRREGKDMHWPGTTAAAERSAGFEAGSALPVVAPKDGRVAPVTAPVTPAGVGSTPLHVARQAPVLPCATDPDLFFAESPEDVETAKTMCQDCPVRLACLAGALERREPWGVWGGELFLRGEVVPRKRPRGRPRKTEVAA